MLATSSFEYYEVIIIHGTNINHKSPLNQTLIITSNSYLYLKFHHDFWKTFTHKLDLEHNVKFVYNIFNCNLRTPKLLRGCDITFQCLHKIKYRTIYLMLHYWKKKFYFKILNMSETKSYCCKNCDFLPHVTISLLMCIRSVYELFKDTLVLSWPNQKNRKANWSMHLYAIFLWICLNVFLTKQ